MRVCAIALLVDFPVVGVSAFPLEALIKLVRGNHPLCLIVTAEALENELWVNQ